MNPKKKKKVYLKNYTNIYMHTWMSSDSTSLLLRQIFILADLIDALITRLRLFKNQKKSPISYSCACNQPLCNLTDAQNGTGTSSFRAYVFWLRDLLMFLQTTYCPCRLWLTVLCMQCRLKRYGRRLNIQY